MSITPTGPGSAANINAAPEDIAYTRDAQRQQLRPLNSLVASAQRITAAQVKQRRGFGKPEAWQDDAWDMFDLVGEQRFLATTLAGRLSQAKFYVGKLSDDPIEQPSPLDDDESLPARCFAYFGDSPQTRAQMVNRMGINLFLPGDGYFVGIPRHLLPDYEGDGPDSNDPMVALDDLEWRMLSLNEVGRSQDDVTLRLGETKEEQVICSADEIFLIRVWRPHPRYHWKADSPTHASLPVLRELVGLTMHISAQVDSRLAGAGILVVPASARRSIAIAAGIDPDLEEDPFTEALIEAMMTAIRDRDSAAALVPLVITVPDDATGLFQHITFSTPLDTEARNLRDEAIRRLALGQDAPPELLLGTGGMNHWGAWLVREDVVTTHIEPPLALIADAITSQFLWPVLIEQGMDEAEAREYVVWYDVSHMVQRPNRLADAQALHAVDAISDDALREAGGFSEDDAPADMSRSVEMAITMAQANPALVDNLKEIIAAFDEVLNPTAVEKVDIATTDAPEEGEDIVDEGEANPSATSAPDEGKARPTTAAPVDGPPAGALAQGGSVRPQQWARVMEDGTVESRNMTLDEILRTYDSKAPDQPLPKPENPPTETFGITDEDKARIDAQPTRLGKVSTAARIAGEYAYDPDAPTAVIVAVPQTDAAATILSDVEGGAHATIAFFGEIGTQVTEADKQALIEHVQALAAQTEPFVGTVTSVEPLGNDDPPAQVWKMECPALHDLFKECAVTEPYAKASENGVTRYPEYLPHVSITYGDAPQQAANVRAIPFNALALWWGDEHIEFPLVGTGPSSGE
jgi:hypothetical protein